ncbi:MAG TPA: peptidoglycan-binding domain-containing protein [Candidatus Dormibacteraeota bacterium]|nr:peptidoglycan-binding domain-containing protein [Candidatus Dormibacteraeota bacterium]
MRINFRKLTHLASSLLLAAGLGVFSDAVKAESSGANKPAGSAAHKGPHGKKSSKKSRRRERGQKAPTPDRIAEIQQALAKDGSYTGTPNGKWDESTQQALRKFQESHGLTPTGKLDARSLQQLGLGSPITGLAPPSPSNTSSKLTPSSTQAAQRRN